MVPKLTFSYGRRGLAVTAYALAKLLASVKTLISGGHFSSFLRLQLRIFDGIFVSVLNTLCIYLMLYTNA